MVGSSVFVYEKGSKNEQLTKFFNETNRMQEMVRYFSDDTWTMTRAGIEDLAKNFFKGDVKRAEKLVDRIVIIGDAYNTAKSMDEYLPFKIPFVPGLTSSKFAHDLAVFYAVMLSTSDISTENLNKVFSDAISEAFGKILQGKITFDIFTMWKTYIALGEDVYDNISKNLSNFEATKYFTKSESPGVNFRVWTDRE